MKLKAFLVISLLSTVGGNYVEVSTTKGRVLGCTEVTSRRTTYYAFQGIRYANPPLRFEPAVEVSPWTELYDATYGRPICIQVVRTTFNESEDCLYLNIYTPRLPKKRNASLAVMFWIHGGGFVGGESQISTTGPDYLIDDNVVVVTAQYRLGALGFLSAGNETLPGNNGMKDLVLALKFVKANIHKFGGNPTKVTIFGQSAGSAIVSYLLLSPLTQNQGYFRNAIMQSGNALMPWTFQRRPDVMYNDLLQVTLCNWAIPSNAETKLNCLKTADIEVIRAGQLIALGITSVLSLNLLNGIGFAPVLEKPSSQAAVTNLTYQTLSEGKISTVPFVMGITSQEVLMPQNDIAVLRLLICKNSLSSPISVPEDMYASDDDIRNNIEPRIRDFYFNSSIPCLAGDEDILRYLTDNLFTRGFREYFSLNQKKSKSWCYVFSYYGPLSGNMHPLYAGLGSAGHADDLNYIFKKSQNSNREFPQQDIVVRDRMVRMWTNFAKYGDPTPSSRESSTIGKFTWPTAYINETNIRCTNIDKELTLLSNPNEKSYQMWRKLYMEYGHPRDTY